MPIRGQAEQSAYDAYAKQTDPQAQSQDSAAQDGAPSQEAGTDALTLHKSAQKLDHPLGSVTLGHLESDLRRVIEQFYTKQDVSETVVSSALYHVTGNLQVDGSVLFSAVHITGNVDIDGNLNVDGTLDAGATVLDSLNVLGTMTKNGDAVATEAYVNSAGAVLATPNTVMKRDANGRSQIVAPTADAEVVNKKYVDDLILRTRRARLFDNLQTKAMPTTIGFSDAIWSPEWGLFVMPGSLGAGTTTIYTSPDGYTMTARTSPTSLLYPMIAYKSSGGGLALVIQQTAAGVVKSTNGTTWAAATALPTATNRGIAYLDYFGRWIVISAISSASTTCAWTSDNDGTSWTPRTRATATYGPTTIAYNPNTHRLLCGCWNTTPYKYLLSDDGGATFTEYANPFGNNPMYIFYLASANKFIAFLSTASTRYCLSSDGINWTEYAMPTGSSVVLIRHPTNIAELNCMVIPSESTFFFIQMTVDGLHWTRYFYPTVTNSNIRNVVYSPSLKMVLLSQSSAAASMSFYYTQSWTIEE